MPRMMKFTSPTTGLPMLVNVGEVMLVEEDIRLENPSRLAAIQDGEKIHVKDTERTGYTLLYLRGSNRISGEMRAIGVREDLDTVGRMLMDTP